MPVWSAPTAGSAPTPAPLAWCPRRRHQGRLSATYLPKHFEQTDPAALQALLRAHPLATLVSVGPDGPTADRLALECDADGGRDAGPHGCLRGHVARANPLRRNAPGTPVLAVFCGSQACISPSHDPSQAQAHKVVPTWNYAVVHAHGMLRTVEDAPWLHALVSRLTGGHETTRARPWAVSDAPDDHVQQMLRAIGGIEIPLQRLVGKWKLSQNRSQPDLQGVLSGLQVSEDADAIATAALMRQFFKPG